jgi:general secretion pathway protein G
MSRSIGHFRQEEGPRLGAKPPAGFTLIEIMMVVAIAGILAGLAIPGYYGYLDKARIARAIAEIRYIEKSVKAFYFSSDEYPDTLAAAGAGNIADPWGTPYQYLKLAGAGPGNGGGGGGGPGGGNTRWWFEPASAYAAPSGPGGSSGGGASGGASGGGQGGGGSGSAGGGGGASGAGQGGGGSPPAQPRKDRFLVPINSDFDLYSMGKDRESVAPLTAKQSHDDIVRANDGAFVGLASEF